MLDVNVSYQEVGLGPRLGGSVYLLSQIPERLVMSIVSLAKLVFFSGLTALTFGRVSLFSYETQVSFYKTCNNMGSLFLCLTASLFPINSAKGMYNLNSWCFKCIEQKTDKESHGNQMYYDYHMNKNIL